MISCRWAAFVPIFAGSALMDPDTAFAAKQKTSRMGSKLAFAATFTHDR